MIPSENLKYENVSLYSICLARKWEVCKFVMSFKTDFSECDDMGYSALDALMEYRSNPDKYPNLNESDWKNIHEISEILLKSSELKYTDNVPELPEVQMLTKMINDPELRKIQRMIMDLNTQYATICKEALAKLLISDVHSASTQEPALSAATQEPALCHQTIAQHKNVIWSLSNRERVRYFKKIQGSPKTKTVNISFENIKDISLKFIDLRKRKRYNFLVHTTSGLPKILEKTLETGAGFIQTTPFFSCSLIDKNTKAAAMDHQDTLVKTNQIPQKILFHLSLILEAAEGAVLQAFPVDAWSPMLSPCTEKVKLDQISEVYISYLNLMKAHFNNLETMISKELTQPISLTSTSLSTFDAEQMFKILSKDPHFSMPDSRNQGFVPQLTPKQILKQTRFCFNEVIVAGNRNNKISGILVEQASLDAFIERLKKLQGEELKQVRESLALLSRSKYPLVLVNTRQKGHKLKVPLKEKFINMYSSFQIDGPVINKELLRLYRLRKSRYAKMQAENIERLDQRLKRHMEKLKGTYKKLECIREQVTGKKLT